MLTPAQKQRVKDLYVQHGKGKVVASITKHSINTVMAVLRGKERRIRATPAVPKKIDDRTATRIKRVVHDSIMAGRVVTARILKEECHVDASLVTIRRHLSTTDVVYEVQKQVIVLTPAHKAKRLAFAKQLMENNVDIRQVVFSDEKRFNGDGPDHLGSYVFKNGPKVPREKRQAGGIGVMVLGAMSSTGKVFIKVGSLTIASPNDCSSSTASTRARITSWTSRKASSPGPGASTRMDSSCSSRITRASTLLVWYGRSWSSRT